MDTSSKRHDETGHGGGSSRAPKPSPQWASGLKQLYDSVVEEDLPDSFKDLLSKLDDDS